MRPTKTTRWELQSLVADGYTMREIAGMLDYGVRYVERLCYVWEIKVGRFGRRPDPQARLDVLAAVERGALNNVAIGRRLGISRQAASRYTAELIAAGFLRCRGSARHYRLEVVNPKDTAGGGNG